MNKTINGSLTFTDTEGHMICQTFVCPSPACPNVKALLDLIVLCVNEETDEHFLAKRDTKKIAKELGYE